MKKSESTSLIDAEIIKNYIIDKYNGSNYTVYFRDRGEKCLINIDVFTKEKGFQVKTTLTFDSSDIFSFSEKILKKRDIDFMDSFSIKSVFDRDNNLVFKGVTFSWKDYKLKT